MAREDYEAVIGLEVHAELSTKTKIFCSCPTTFGAEPNTHVCPICMAMPGTLPVLNEKVVEYAVKAGLATNCEISKDSKNDRKNYYYPDLPKSYQISQYDKPLCNHGYVEIDDENGNKKKIGILRIHIEEDAGKLNHDEFGGDSLVDLNRAGVPLIEIVSGMPKSVSCCLPNLTKSLMLTTLLFNESLFKRKSPHLKYVLSSVIT